MTKIKLYKIDVGISTRAVMMVFEALGLPVDMIDVNLTAGEQYTPEFLKKNPLATVPVLEDGDICLHDSHAILMYLVDVYGTNDALYPKDIKKRSFVNQKLFFEAAIIHPRLLNAGRPIFSDEVNKITDTDRNGICEIYKFVEEFLTKSKFIAGDDMTIADISVIAGVSTAVYLVPLNVNKYPKTRAWMDEMEKQPFYEKYNKPGVTALGDLLTTILYDT